jgi:hypothetical protein
MGLAEKWNGILDEVIKRCKSIPELGDQTITNDKNATTWIPGTGNVFAVQIIGLPNQKYIDSLDLSINVADGNVRVKIFSESQDKPDLLLAESDSLPVTSTGIHNFRLRKQVEVPIDGQLWVAFETNSALLDVDRSTGQSSGSLYTVVHSFGDGPDPWSGGTSSASPFWTQIHYDPKVVKYNGVRGSQIEDFYAVVWADEMIVESLTNRGSNNIFITNIDISYRGVDFQNGLTKMLSKTSDIYDAIHMTTLNGQVQSAKVEIFPDEVVEGENLYLIGSRIQITTPKVVIQT